MSFTYPLALIALIVLPVFIWLGRPRSSWGRGRATVALILRALIVLAVILSLAGLQLTRASDTLAVVFLIDDSDSMPPAATEAARQFAQAAIDGMRPDDQAAIVVFGADALVERPMTPSGAVGPIESEVLPLNTDLAEAIRLALALYPPGAARRMVILSDGLANVGDAEEAARLAAASGVEIVAVPFALAAGSEVLVTDVDLPTRLNQDQQFDLNVTIESAVETPALLRIIAGSEVVVEAPVQLVEGVNRYAFTLDAGAPGLTSYRVQIVPQGEDVYYQNNELSAFTQVIGPPRVLVVAQDETETVNLTAALLAQGLQVDQTVPAGLPLDLASLSAYDSLVLANVPARELGPRRMQLIQSYVRDLGGGLVVVGGPNSYGPGGYFLTPLEEALPVQMQLKDQERLPQLSVLYVIDKSGSMSDFSPGGFEKIELAKEAILRSVQLLGPLDRVGVIAFDESASWVVPLGPADNRTQISSRVGSIRAGGGTDIYAGLLAASREFPADPSRLRHIVLLTDGGASEAGIPELVQDMYDQYDITLSVIAITAQGEQYGQWLIDLPDLADGRFHHAFNVDSLPEIFTEETVIATRAYIIEEPFFPALASSSPILTGIEGTPQLNGYVGATIKPAAENILVTGMQDPLLAAWQYGLGRSVAWTSDATGRWASNWITWDGYARFWSQAVRWTITEGVNQNVEVRVQQQGESQRIIVDALADDGSYLNGLDMAASVIAPDLSTTSIDLQQVAPGRYEAAFTPGDEGAYFVRIAGADADGQPDAENPAVAQTSGWVLAYSPEYRSLDGDPNYLEFVAGLTGGSLIEDPARVFAHNLQTDRARQPVWPWLLVFATVLLPFDIAVRRLVITRSDWAKLWAWLGFGRRRRAEPVQPRTSRVASLLDVKDRVAAEQQPTEIMGLDASPTAQPGVGEGLRPSRAAEDREAAPVREPQPAPRRSAEPADQPAPRTTASSLLAAKRRREQEESDDD